MISHILYIIGSSLFATLVIFPISSLDVYYVGSFTRFPFYITLPIIIIVEILTALLAYKFAYWLVPKIIRKEKNKQKLIEMGSKIEKWGFWGLVLVGCTPLPYSITIYAAAAVRWGTVKQFSLAILIGRSIKYSLITIGVLAGIEVFL